MHTSHTNTSLNNTSHTNTSHTNTSHTHTSHTNTSHTNSSLSHTHLTHQHLTHQHLTHTHTHTHTHTLTMLIDLSTQASRLKAMIRELLPLSDVGNGSFRRIRIFSPRINVSCGGQNILHCFMWLIEQLS